jgi:acetoin utilization deacetylase AcuC-like enzyme
MPQSLSPAGTVPPVTVLRMPVVWSPRHRRHAPDGGYWLGVREAGDEEPIRGECLVDGLRRAGAVLTEAPDLGLAPITAVHHADFVDFMRRAYPAWVAEGHLEVPGQPQAVGYLFGLPGFAARRRHDRRPATIRAELGLYAVDTMTLISEGTFSAACAAVHCAVHAADLVANGTPAAYAAVRPPGHHAGPAFFGGSCYFNNAAAAAQHLRAAGFGRVAIVDIDAHQGNGTQEIFWDRADVLYASVHVDPGEGWFPHLVGFGDERGGGEGEGWNHNEPIAGGSGDEVWLAAFDRLLRSVEAHGSEAVVVSLGVDAAVDDPAAPLKISPAGFAEAGRRLAALDLPTVFVQEGGYDLELLSTLVLITLTAFES